jgi:toxin ParE1/3/4
MKLVWAPQALQDLASLRAYIAEDNPAAAQRVASSIVRVVNDGLPRHPDIGRPGRVPGTRELVIPRTPFIVPYRVRANTIVILGAYHGARRWPDSF